MTNWTILATPYFHFWIAVVALLVLLLVIWEWRSLTRKLNKQAELLNNLHATIKGVPLW